MRPERLGLPSGQRQQSRHKVRPWLTLQHANDSLPTGGAAAGTCIFVIASTQPYAGVVLTTGGNLASRTGYVVWRCSLLDACIVNGTAGQNGNAGFWSLGTGVSNYVQIDGFKIVGNNSVYGVGVGTAGRCCGAVGTFSSHHIWVLNSVIYGFGQGGIAYADGDYTYAIHNKVYNNAAAASCDNGAQGSGIGDVVALDVTTQYPNYVATPDDRSNPNPLIGSFVTGTTWFHKSYSWNRVFNNYISPCTGSTSADTDGNGIILDTFGTRNNNGTGNAVAYADQTLIAFNIVYNNGGGGIHVFDSEFATVANNTVYNNGLDPYNQGSDRTAIDTNGSYGDTVINNIAVAIPAAPAGGTCTFGAVPYAQFNSAILGGVSPGSQLDVFTNNITQLQGGNNSCWGAFGQDATSGEAPMFNGDMYSHTQNHHSTDPMWINSGAVSVGTESTPPSGINFALKPGSPAIGFGLTETYLPPSSVDAGACAHTLTKCP